MIDGGIGNSKGMQRHEIAGKRQIHDTDDSFTKNLSDRARDNGFPKNELSASVKPPYSRPTDAAMKMYHAENIEHELMNPMNEHSPLNPNFHLAGNDAGAMQNRQNLFAAQNMLQQVQSNSPRNRASAAEGGDFDYGSNHNPNLPSFRPAQGDIPTENMPILEPFHQADPGMPQVENGYDNTVRSI